MARGLWAILCRWGIVIILGPVQSQLIFSSSPFEWFFLWLWVVSSSDSLISTRLKTWVWPSPDLWSFLYAPFSSLVLCTENSSTCGFSRVPTFQCREMTLLCWDPSPFVSAWKGSPDSKAGAVIGLIHLMCFLILRFYYLFLPDSQFLRTIVSYFSSIFLVVSVGRVNTIYITQSWPEVE